LEARLSLNLEYCPPPASIADSVSAFYAFETQDAALDELERADLSQFRFHLSGSGHVHFPQGRVVAFPHTALMGPRMSATRVTASGPIRVFGMGLLPAGWARLTGWDAGTYANQLIDAEALFPDFLGDLTEQLGQCTSIEPMVKLFTARFLEKCPPISATTMSFIKMVDDWLESAMNPDVATLLDQSAMGQRTLERTVRKYYGAPPKQLARKYRALRAANAIVHGDGPWQDYANTLFFDHSHCIRDIKAFVGVTPGQLRDIKSELLNLTFGRRLLAGRIANISAQS
jgi:AraC-like DNA-binding protein